MNLFTLLNPYKNFNYLRYSVGMAMMLNGYPTIFFFRDTLKIGPASNVWSATFFAFALLLMTPSHIFLRLYKPNFKLLTFSSLFFALLIYHFFTFNDSDANWFLEFGNILFVVAFVILLLHIPNEVKETVLPVILIFAIFNNLTLVYSLITDPYWRIGMRAAVTFANDDAFDRANPHVPARNAIFCILASVVLIWKYKNIILRILISFNVIFSLGVLLLTQSKASLLSLGLMIFVFLFFNARISHTLKFVKTAFSWRTPFIFLVLYFGVNFILNRYNNLYGILYGYWDIFGKKIGDIMYTAFGLKVSDSVIIDASSMGRVDSFYYFSLTLKSPIILLFGRGYKSLYMDVPVLEALINHGVFGLIFFGGFVYYLCIYTFKELRSNTNVLTTFLAYVFLYLLVGLFSGGRPYDLSYWFPFALMIRFLGIKYYPNTLKKI
jgi:hypothetical protein